MGLKGGSQAVSRLRRLGGDGVKKAISPALFAAGELIQVEAQISITRGAVSGKNHVPSKPGEPPNADTHTLANYINVEHKAGDLTVRVRSDASYSAALEFGTSRMSARPYMRPARDKMKPEAKALIDQAYAQFVRSTKG
jgi:HK97 gp10 family phage protein